MNFGTVDELLDFAIQKEEQAAAFYEDLAGNMDRPHMREVFQTFAREELGHKAKLQALQQGRLLAPLGGKVMDLRIADIVVDVEPSGDLSYQDALIIAMKREKASFKLYRDLAAMTDDENVREILLALAQEEAKHKMWFEIEYDDVVLQDN